MPLIPATAYRPVKVRERTSWALRSGSASPGLGRVRIVVSFAQDPRWATRWCWSRIAWAGVPKIISLCGHRWPPDTFDQDGQGQWGCNAYRMRGRRSHWKTLVSGVRGPFAVAPDLSACRGPDRIQGLIQTSSGRLSAAGILLV